MFDVEVEALGDGTWGAYQRIIVSGKSYTRRVFPEGNGAEWARPRSRAADSYPAVDF